MIIKVQYYKENEPMVEFVHEAASYQIQHVFEDKYPKFMKDLRSGARAFAYHPDQAVPDDVFKSMTTCSLLSLAELNYPHCPDRCPIMLKKCTLWVMNNKGDTVQKVVID